MLLLDEFFFPFLRDNAKLFILYLFFTLFTYPFQGLILPQLYSQLFSSLKMSNAPKFFPEILKSYFGNETPHIILKIIAVWLILQVANGAKGWTESIFVPAFLTFARTKIFEQTVKSFSDNYEEIPTGEYITRMLEFTRYLRNILSWSFSEIIPNMIALLVATMYFLKVDKLF